MEFDEDIVKKFGILAGIYRHYKGPLYLVLGLAHDANRETLFDAEEELQFPEGRTVVVYVGLQLDSAHEGPRMAVRTLEDFTRVVCTNPKHTNYGKRFVRDERWGDNGNCDPQPRFSYVGPTYVAGMEEA